MTKTDRAMNDLLRRACGVIAEPIDQPAPAPRPPRVNAGADQRTDPLPEQPDARVNRWLRALRNNR